MNKRKRSSIFSSILIVTTAISLQGCWEEAEPNDDPEEAYWSAQHVQFWSGDWNWPDPGTLPVANGTGNVNSSDSVDNWPISMWNWVTDEVASDVTYFQGTLWLSADADVSIGWHAWRGGDYDEAVWEPMQLRQSFHAPKNVAVSVYVFHLDLDDLTTLYSLEMSGNGTYGFMLTPISE